MTRTFDFFIGFDVNSIITMGNQQNLQRFIDAQQNSYPTALGEIKKGKKQSHWMWFIFPQIAGLGFSSTTIFYSIKSLAEAEQYLQHPVLGKRLIEISNALLTLKSSNANAVMGSPDDAKLKSSMTLFGSLPQTNEVFNLVLDKFYNGEKDNRTLEIITV